MDFGVTFACYNQWPYTKQCVDSLLSVGVQPSQIVAVDNHSSDETVERLQTYGLKRVVRNRSNLGCGVAWNQGITELQSEWTIVMNNDVLVTPGWAEGLINGAVYAGLGVASPSIVNGDRPLVAFDYANRSQQDEALHRHVRQGLAHGVAMAIHESVFMKAGLFRAQPSMMGFEDTLFFHEVQRSGISIGTVGAAWMHHFGSITQLAMKAERGLREDQGLGSRGANRSLGLSWLGRKKMKWRKRSLEKRYRQYELSRFGLTLNSWQLEGHSTTWL
jgi:N-acetylglucosaminyl-diphospho-decaprenol L-rhamnosyltransferase